MNEYEQFAKNIARQAGKIMFDNFKMGMDKKWKSDNSPVTEADLKINKLLIDEVKKIFPEHSVLGEEESNFVGDRKMVWVCDPLDGTLPFSHGVPIFTFSLALVDDGVPILGVIYDPILDRMFYASKGQGAYLNGDKISVNSLSSLANGVVSIDASGEKVGVDFFKTLKGLFDNKCKVFKFISVIYGAMLISAGEFIGTIFLKDTAHDVAAIKILVEEAGGKVTDLNGNEQRYDKKCNGIIASNGLVHDELVKIVKNAKIN